MAYDKQNGRAGQFLKNHILQHFLFADTTTEAQQGLVAIQCHPTTSSRAAS